MNLLSPQHLISCAIGLTLLTSSCQKEDPNALPKATQKGKNTAGFLIDGQVWLPKATITSVPSSAVGATWSKTRYGRSLQFGFGRAQNEDKDRTSFGFYLPDIRQAGTFRLEQERDLLTGNRNPSYGSYQITYPKPSRFFSTGPSAPGQLVITRFDTVARVVAGTFEMTVQEDGGSERHQITQGRFDIKF
ncbi:hypothetical protein [Hymenobacter radiodurans]|uniref:hypothetical protein n=1 Tax=Hymenobacter radiodurans TaxID=2496028 RepID=UPI001058A875|nr:hypothetical protein [Hymenobacter radiodurans]